MFWGFLDPDPSVRGVEPAPDPDLDPSFTKQKKVIKTLIPTVLLLLFDFLSLKNDVNVPQKVISRKTFF
jgi:hypothetical protein